MPQDDVSRDYDVFLSYARKDLDQGVVDARRLAQWLESLGYSVWWDTSLIAGQNWPKELEFKLRVSKRVIVLWTPRAAASDWVKFESNLALSEDKLIPLVIEKCPTPNHWAPIHQAIVTDFDAQKAEILKALAIEPSGSKARERGAGDDARISIASLPTASGALIGRDIELNMLQKAWNSTAPGADPARKTNIVVLHAIGGAGKTALMRHFVDELAYDNFAGAAKVYGWSAYSQGSGDNKTANADEFIAKALGFFGHDLTRYPIQDAVERGRKLAQLVGERRSLLILDGLEPLQEPPLVNKGRLKDRGLAALIKELSAHNKGLLVITSRQELPELDGQNEPRVISHPLDRLGTIAGVALLSHLGVHGRSAEMERAVEEVLGHALSLNLLGTYLDAVHGGDVNQLGQFKLGEIEDAPADFIGDQTARFAKRAARIMEGTIARFEELEGRAATGGEAETAILHIVGLFDRPVEKEALDALLAEPPIPGLTDAFHSLSSQQRRVRWAVAVDRLRKLRLLNAEDPHEPGSLDAHPIVRGHFGSRLQHRAAEAFRGAHRRLYDFYRYHGLPEAFCSADGYGLLALIASYSAEESIKSMSGTSSIIQSAAGLIGTVAFEKALRRFQPDIVADMADCFAAIGHASAAGEHQDAYRQIYFPRVLRGNSGYIRNKLGALNADLACLVNFFDTPWHAPATTLSNETRARILHDAAFDLRALGRLHDALEPFEAGLGEDIAQQNLANAARDASNVSELRLTLGDVNRAIEAARGGIAHADCSGDTYWCVSSRTALADALHQAGEKAAALELFINAEIMQRGWYPFLRKLISLPGFRYCDLLLANGEYAEVIERAAQTPAIGGSEYPYLMWRFITFCAVAPSQPLLAQVQTKYA